jgi:hypothetical protein
MPVHECAYNTRRLFRICTTVLEIIWNYRNKDGLKTTLYVQADAFKKETLSAAREPLHSQNDQMNGNVIFLQPYAFVAADALLEINTATVSLVLLLS